MEKCFRVSVIGKIRDGVSREDIEGLLAPKLAAKGLLQGQALRWISIPGETPQDRYVKLSVVVTAENIDDAWNLDAARHFAAAGYGEMAWKITPVASDDPDGEDTTCSIPADLFVTAAETDACETTVLVPPEPFASDLFWEWIEDMPACGMDERGRDSTEAAAASAILFLSPARGLTSVCAACRKIRDEHGRWRRGHVDEWDPHLSHGICPECAGKLYPDLYRK